MAERYIFNKSLNRRKNPWYWLAIVAFTLCLYSLFSGLTLAAQQRLLAELSLAQVYMIT